MRLLGRWADDIRTSRRGRCDVRVNPVGFRSDFRLDLGRLDHVLPLDDFAFDMLAQLFRCATGRFDAQTRHALFHVGPMPLYGTCAMRVPAIWLKSSVAR